MTGLAEFAADTIKTARAALDRAALTERDLYIGGRRLIRIRAVTGPFADRLLIPFGECAAPAEGPPPPFEVLALDDATAGGPPPAPPWGPDDYEIMDAITGPSGDGTHVAYSVEQRVLTLASLDEGAGVYWARDPAMLPPLELGHTLRNVLHAALRPYGLFFAHAAAVGAGSDGVLLTGLAGAGKSTTALACAERGLRIAGDDFVCVSADPDPAVHLAYATAKLDPAACELLPRSAARAISAADDKVMVSLPPDARAERMAIRAVVVPRIASRAGRRAEPGAPSEALFGLAWATFALPPAERRHAFAALSQIVRSVPVMRIDVGPDDLGAPAAAIRTLLEDACVAT